MTYNLDERINRKGTHTLKWNVSDNELPLWVADMDFKAAPPILAALQKRLENGIFGYTVAQDEWRQAIVNWWDRRYAYQMQHEWLLFAIGVVPAIATAVRQFTQEGDKVLVQSPVYNMFYTTIENNKRHVLENPLKYDGNTYTIDFVDLEAKLSDPKTSLMVLCNPHNPVGRIWSKEDLDKIGKLCDQYNVIVVADEIHCDLTDAGYTYTPFASVSEINAKISISCFSVSKSFNIAGLKSAFVSVPDDTLRMRMTMGLHADNFNEPNAFAIDSVIAAYEESEDWLEATKAYIESNKKRVDDFLANHLPNVKRVHSHATYLLWLDVSQVTDQSSELQAFIRAKTGLYISSGHQYRGNGQGFLRMNIACPVSILDDALNRLKSGIDMYVKA